MTGFDDAQEFWDRRFAAQEYIFGTHPNVFLAAQAHRLPPRSRVLELACGEGRNSVWLAAQGHHVTGVDISPNALIKARKLAADRNVSVEFVQSDLRQWRWEASAYDAVVCIFIQFASPDERTQLFEGMHRTLNSRGLVFLQGYTPKQLDYKTGGPPELSHMYTQAMLADAFKEFEIALLREHEATLSEGTKHVGHSALIDLVAQKK